MRRVEPGTIVAALGAVGLLVALFLDWYGPGMSAWTSFEVWDGSSRTAEPVPEAPTESTKVIRDEPSS